jgi:hypothetical protein
MAIAPIDLQTLFTQLDKVARTQTSQREGQAIHQAVQDGQAQRKTEAQVQQVNEAQDMGEGTEKIKDRASGQDRQGADGKGKGKDQNEEAEEDKSIVFSDPSRGKNIDISL